MRILRKLVGTLLLLAVILAVPAAYLGLACRGSDGGSSAISSLVPPELRRTLDVLPGYREEEARSYLSYPDWYAIHAARDYARYIDNRYPSGFAFFTAALEYWRGYCGVNRYTSMHFDTDWAAHMRLYAYGVSHSLKYALNGLYENTAGRVSEAFAPVTASAEDLFARSFADDYSDWLLSAPWYDYPFFARLQNLWTAVPFTGPGQVRKVERRFALSAELAINGIHAALVRGPTLPAGAPQQEIHAVMKGLPADTGAIDGRIRVLETYEDGLKLVLFPRGPAFSEIVPKFAGRGVEFLEIAGNDTILMTAIGRNGWSPPPETGEQLFETPILSGDGGTRFGLAVPVPLLVTAIELINRSGGRFERVYDY